MYNASYSSSGGDALGYGAIPSQPAVFIVLSTALFCHGHKPPPMFAPWGTTPGLEVIYGATFDLTHGPHRVDAEEVYQFVEKGKKAPKILAYCLPIDSDFLSCPFRPVVNNEIRLKYTYNLEKGREYTQKSYLYEEFVLSGREILVLCRCPDGATEPRILNRFEGLKDGFGNQNNKRMTTVVLPRNTFVALDEHELEPSPSVDIVHYPRPFFEESLSPRTTVITRVNPSIPLALRWSSQRLVSAGIDNVIGQWLLLSLSGVTPIAIVGWLARWLWRKKPLIASAPVPAEQPE